MAQATPEPSEERKNAVKKGYRVTVGLAAILLAVVLMIPSSDSSGWIAFIPPAIGVLVYYFYLKR